MTIFDYFVITVISLSTLCGMWRGLLAEVYGLIKWIVVLLVAAIYAPVLICYVPANWPGGVLTQYLITCLVLIVAVLVVFSLIRALITRIAEAGGLRGIDCTLGILFGLMRGIFLVLLLVVVAAFTTLPRESFWRNALFRPYTERAIQELKPFLPAMIASYIRF
ncbi:CvpA family protein [Candidatus Vallotia cooleyia]|uniref:CvpA family protein n=1 Tax=Candidatus Vallotiella adelgis TaxID=1177211 RepID=UPI001D02EE46|nr:CvpA family protein [Candidatus Vallotia cooleyia]UDG82348.1 Colicin V production protein [Candidatus Vallotia cooleyia]